MPIETQLKKDYTPLTLITNNFVYRFKRGFPIGAKGHRRGPGRRGDSQMFSSKGSSNANCQVGLFTTFLWKIDQKV